MFFSTVADPRYLSRIPDTDFYPSRITDPGFKIQDTKKTYSGPGSAKLVLKVPKCEIFDRSDFHYFYTIHALKGMRSLKLY
jgi:hypothetical protein